MHKLVVRGQALIEYLFIFAFIGMIAVGMMKGLGESLSSSMGSLNFFLTQELSVGVCDRWCLGDQYKNIIKSGAGDP